MKDCIQSKELSVFLKKQGDVFYLKKSGQWGDCSQLSKYFEVDFPEVVVKKAMAIKRRPQLYELIQNVRIGKVFFFCLCKKSDRETLKKLNKFII